MINLGPYSGKNCPNVRFQPTVIDRILEGTALLIVLVTWISIYWLYTQREGALLPAVWVMGGCSIFCFLLTVVIYRIELERLCLDCPTKDKL